MGVAELDPLLRRPRPEDLGEDGLELPVAPCVVGERAAGPALEQVHAPDALAEVPPELLLAGHEQHVTVRRGIDLVADTLPHTGRARRSALVVVGLVAVDLVGGPLVGPPRLDAVPVEVGGRVGLGHVEVTALAGLASPNHGGEDGEGAVDGTGVDADTRVLGQIGEAVFVAGHRHLAGPRVVGDAVAGHLLVRTGGAVARDRAEHDAGVDLSEPLVRQTPAGQRPGSHGLDHDVGVLGQVEVDLHTLGLAQVDGDRALAAVDVQREQ